jgi:serine/threonine protein phosphatase PrpC
MKLISWGQTDVGRVRDHNEDAVVVDPRMAFYMVADGVGGGRAGDVASALAAQVVHQRVSELHTEAAQSNLLGDADAMRTRILDCFNRALQEASEAIYFRGMKDETCRGMASTTVAFQILGPLCVIAHVGDSRLYLVRGGVTYQLTEDHTLLQKLLQTGALTPEEGRNFPHRHVISRSLGSNPHVEVDLLVVDVCPGDRFVACSDGLSDHVGSDEMQKVVMASPPQRAAQKLIAMANERGGEDNITVIVVEAQGGQAQPGRLRTEQKVGFLRDIFLFKDLNFQEILKVLTVVREVRFKDGDVVVREGDFGDELFVVVEGMVGVSEIGVPLTRIGKGGQFGELGLLGNSVRTATVTALGATVVLGIKKSDFFQLISADHGMAVKLLWGFLQNVAGRMRALSAELAQIKSGMGRI